MTSMLLQPAPNSTLWLGLRSGHMLLINAASQTALLATKRHVSAVKCIQSVKALGTKGGREGRREGRKAVCIVLILSIISFFVIVQ